MPAFALANTAHGDYEIYSIEEFETLGEALEYAQILANEMNTDIEVFERQGVIQPLDEDDKAEFLDSLERDYPDLDGQIEVGHD